MATTFKEPKTNGRIPKDLIPEAPVAAQKAVPDETVLVLDKIEFHELTCRVVGTAPLVTHPFGPKAQRGLWENQGIIESATGRVRGKKVHDPKNPVEDFLDSVYTGSIDDEVEAYGRDGKVITRYGPDDPKKLREGLHPVWARFKRPKDGKFLFPAHAFREAMGSASMASGVTKDIVSVRRLVSVARIMLPIETTRDPQMLYMIADVQGKSDLRFRAQFDEWAMTVVVRYCTRIASDATVLNLLRLAGVLIGIGEMRGEKKIGTYGGFVIDPSSVRVETIKV